MLPGTWITNGYKKVRINTKCNQRGAAYCLRKNPYCPSQPKASTLINRGCWWYLWWWVGNSDCLKEKDVDYFHFDAELQLNNCINNYVDIILSSDHTVIDYQEVHEPEEDIKQGIKTTTTSAKKQKKSTWTHCQILWQRRRRRKKDDINTPSSKFPYKKKKKHLKTVLEILTNVQSLQRWEVEVIKKMEL